jgi:lysophospholipase L1-like esterase
MRAFSFSPAMNKLANITALAFAALLFTACGGSESPIPEAAAATRRPLTVVIGDSITAGYIPTAGVLQLRQDLSYTAEVAQLGDVITAAVGGATTQAALSNQVFWLRSLPADVVVVMLGTNDAALGLDRGQALANVRAIADAWPKARLVLVAPPPYNAATDAWLAPWAADLKTLAASRGAGFVDLYAASRPDWFCHPTDRHPCEAAHREIGALVRLAAFAP